MGSFWSPPPWRKTAPLKRLRLRGLYDSKKRAVAWPPWCAPYRKPYSMASEIRIIRSHLRITQRARGLRGPTAILFISRNTCCDSIAKLFFVLVFMGYRTIIARYVAKWGIAQMCLCGTKYQGGVSHHFGGVLTSLKKYRAIWGIAAIVSQYRAIWGH